MAGSGGGGRPWPREYLPVLADLQGLRDAVPVRSGPVCSHRRGDPAAAQTVPEQMPCAHTHTDADGRARVLESCRLVSRVLSTARLMRLDRLKHSTLPTRCRYTPPTYHHHHHHIIIIISRLPERHKPNELATIKQQNSRKKSVITKNTKRKRNYKYKKALGGDANTTRCGAWQTP